MEIKSITIVTDGGHEHTLSVEDAEKMIFAINRLKKIANPPPEPDYFMDLAPQYGAARDHLLNQHLYRMQPTTVGTAVIDNTRAVYLHGHIPTEPEEPNGN